MDAKYVGPFVITKKKGLYTLQYPGHVMSRVNGVHL